ncbi:MAG: DUF3999 family protein [Acidobacteriota bacterium]
MIHSCKISVLCIWTLLVFQIPSVFSQTGSPELDRFQYERTIIPGGDGSNRLSIDSVLLSGGNSQWQFHQEGAGSERDPMVIATGGLSDFRIYDASNREIPYLFILPPKPDAEWLDGMLSPMAPTETTSGFQIDLGRSLLVDRLFLSGIPAPFVKRCTLEASDDEWNWIRLRSDSTVFDLPEVGLRNLEIEFAEREYRHFRIVWDDEGSERIPMPHSVSARLVSAGSLAPQLEVPLQFERRESEPTISRYRIKLPGPQLPIRAIKLSVKGGNVLRQARISEGRLDRGDMRPVTIGTATLRREMQGDLSAAQLSIKIMPPREATVELVIEDGNNPPLEISKISAVFAYLPWIYFESPGEGLLTARYGYSKLSAPKYDLEAARLSAARSQTLEAQWGEVRENQAETAIYKDDTISTEGSEIDLKLFGYIRRIQSGSFGLNVLPLDAAVLAHSSTKDLRIVSDNGNQIPYLTERLDEPLSLDLPQLEKISISLPETRDVYARTGTRSLYLLHLPYRNLPEAQLVFTTSSRVFRRHMSVRIEKNPYNERQESWSHTIAQGTWMHSDPEIGPPPLSLELPSLNSKDLLIVVEEGDNQPLPITSVRLLLPSYQLRFFRGNDAELSLVYGSSALLPPNYDLAILTPRLTGAAAEEVSMGPEAAIAGEEETSLTPTFFWVILIVSVVVLSGLIVRLVKKSG